MMRYLPFSANVSMSSISKVVRIQAFVSLIKAAHLTLFELLGYRYALSSGGQFVGRQILGEFFLQNRDKPKGEVLANAQPFFRKFATMSRPIVNPVDFQGTISDGRLLACRENSADDPWALIVIVKTSRMLHSVMVPNADR